MAIRHVLEVHGRFCELYTDRGSHFCTTKDKEHGPADEQQGEVARVLKALGIRQILAKTPQARGRCERAFKTIQGRLVAELKRAKIDGYEAANQYLKTIFIEDFNRRFTVKPQQQESAFMPLIGINLDLLFAKTTERVVRNDHTVAYKNLILQIPPQSERMHYVRCPVKVHEYLSGGLAISYQGQILGCYASDGRLQINKRRQETKTREVA